MNLHNLWQMFLIFILSAFKFSFGGVPAAILAKYPFFKAVTITTAGGITGVIAFTNIGQWAQQRWNKFRIKHFPYHKHKPNKILNHKLIRHIAEKWGLAGIAFLTPLFLSIPIGTSLAVHFFPNKQKVISYMLVSIMVWDIVLCYFYNDLYKYILHFLHLHFHTL